MIVSKHERARYYMHVGREPLDAEELAMLEKHLDACAECRAYAVELDSMQTHLARAMRAHWLGQHPQPAMTRTIQARLAGNDRLRHFMSSVGSLAAAVGAVGIVVILSWLLMTTGSFNAEPAATASLPDVVAVPSTPAASLDLVLEGETVVQHAMEVVFTEHDKLIGFDLDREQVSPGETLSVTLHWEQFQGEFWSKLNIVVHLLDADGSSVAYSNSVAFSHAPSLPGSRRDTAIDRIAVPFALTLPDALPAGSYRLVVKSYLTDVGLYPSNAEGVVSVLLTRLWIE